MNNVSLNFMLPGFRTLLTLNRKLPINAQIGGFYVAVKPDGGANWQTRAQIQFLFPKK